MSAIVEVATLSRAIVSESGQSYVFVKCVRKREVLCDGL